MVGVSEIRWTTDRDLVEGSQCSTLIDNGEQQHQKALTIDLKKGLEKCLMEWKLTNSRLMKIKVMGNTSTPLSPSVRRQPMTVKTRARMCSVHSCKLS